MAYFIFLKNSDNIEASLCKIAANSSDLNNLNIIKEDHTIIEVSDNDFNDVRLGKKEVVKHVGNNVTYKNINFIAEDKDLYKKTIANKANYIKTNVLEANPTNHPHYSKWETYYNQLINLNVDNLTFPQTKSEEQLFEDLGQLSLNTLQIP
jgi:hypothetical protein